MKHRDRVRKKRARKIESWIALIALGIVVFCASFAVVSRVEEQQISGEADRMLAYLQTVCRKYDDYELGNMTKDLQSVLNKVKILSTYTGAEVLLQEKTLEQYARYQYLTGVIVLDETGRVACSVDLDGRSNGSLLRTILLEDNVENIMAQPKKEYAEQIQVKDRYYDYAVVARQDATGVVICYSDITDIRGDKYNFSLESLLIDDTFRQDAVTVITDGQTVQGTNVQELQGLSVWDCPIVDLSERVTAGKGELIQLTVDGATWFGKRADYRDYNVYVFYPAESVYGNRAAYMSYVLIGYFLLGILGMLWVQYRRREKMRSLEKETQLIHAIGSIYSANLILYPMSNTWQIVVASPQLREALAGCETAKDMLRAFRNSQVQEEHREMFAKLSDLDTLGGRLGAKVFEGFQFEHVNGNWYQALLIPEAWDERGNLEMVMLVFRDVTTQRKKELDYQEQLRETAEDAERANAAKTDFLRRMSHDIRTPINGIRGMADIGLSVEGNPVKATECFTKIISASNFLLELVNNVLDMSKLESGEIQLEEKAFDLRELLQDTAIAIEAQAREQGLTFHMGELEEEAHWHVIGSPLHIRQILQNIMSNAVKYNRENGTIDVRCHEVAVTEDEVTFEFVCADSGIGMSPEFQEHAFDLFAQEHKKNEARSTYTGTGLGLAIAKKIADSMGDELTFSSKEGVGTVFTVLLHLKQDHGGTEKTRPDSVEVDSIAGMQILVVEDNVLNMEIAEYMLEQKGVKVLKAGNGKMALEMFVSSEPDSIDMILMDIMMPVMDGLEATRQIRALNRPDAATVPILAMSANAFSDDIACSREAGMNEHLSKPLEFGKVLEAIARYRRK